MVRYHQFLFLLFISSIGWCQTFDDFSISPHYRSHTLYTIGTVSGQDKSSANVDGLGVVLQHQFNDRIGLAFDFGRSFVDTFAFTKNSSHRFFINQYALKFAYSLRSIYDFQPTVMVGYGATHIKELTRLDLTSIGFDVQPAVQLSYALTNKVRIQYQFAYQFSLNPTIPHSTRSQWGIGFYPFRKKPDKELLSRLDNAYAKLLSVEEELKKEQNEKEEIKAELSRAQSKQNDLLQIVDSLKSEESETDILLKENQLLLDEIRYYQRFADSLLYLNYDSLVPCDIYGEPIKEKVDLEEGYYVSVYNLDTSRLRTILITSPYLNTKTLHVFKRSNYYQILAFISKDLTAAKNEFFELEIPDLVKLIRIR